MGDAEGARDILDEVIAEGSETQQQEARELIGKLA
jgi:pilus assembly protein FimV